MLDCSLRSGKDRQQFIGFALQFFQACFLNKASIAKQLKPEGCLIGFFDGEAHLGDEVGCRTGPANGVIIRCH